MYVWSRIWVYRYRRGVCMCGAGYGCTDITDISCYKIMTSENLIKKVMMCLQCNTL